MIRPDQIAVIIPVLDDQTHLARDLVNVIQDIAHFPVILGVNGGTANTLYIPGVYAAACASARNPYAGRNAAIRKAWKQGFEAVYLLDHDGQPEDPHAWAESIRASFAADEQFLNGPTTTSLPETSQHFRWLKDFECYNVFPPNVTLGCNMGFTRGVFQAVGAMRETFVSGGDVHYGQMWEAIGNKISWSLNRSVVKHAATHTLEGIIQRQIRRGKFSPNQVLLETLAQRLKLNLSKLAHKFEPNDLPGSYPAFVDQLFKTMADLGHLSRHLDRPTSPEVTAHDRLHPDQE